MSRLTYKNKKGEWSIKNKYPDGIALVCAPDGNYYIGTPIDRLAELEDKLESGQLVDTTPYIEEIKSDIPFKYKVIKPTIHRRNVEMCRTQELAEKVIAKLTDAEALLKEEDGEAQQVLADFIEKIITLCKEHEKEYSHLCNSKKECHDETVRYIAVLRLRQQIEGLYYAETKKSTDAANPCVTCETVEVRCEECSIPKPPTHGSNARPPKGLEIGVHINSLKAVTEKETAAEIYELCCRHGTTYIKNYLKEKYGVGAKEE